MIEIHQFPCLSDNYGFLVHAPQTGETIAIDTPDAGVYLAEAAKKNWTITAIWNTHWHPDHVGGNTQIKAETGCEIIAPADEIDKIPAVDRGVRAGDRLTLAGQPVEIIAVPGHTLGHIAYHLPDNKTAFVGDALFALGCGRVFEGDMAMMWESLCRIRDLPDETTIYCAHEYTEANAKFAETIERGNAALTAYIAEIRAKRAGNKPTIPTNLGLEKATNPFLRADVATLQNQLGTSGGAVATFTKIRAAKDVF